MRIVRASGTAGADSYTMLALIIFLAVLPSDAGTVLPTTEADVAAEVPAEVRAPAEAASERPKCLAFELGEARGKYEYAACLAAPRLRANDWVARQGSAESKD